MPDTNTQAEQQADESQPANDQRGDRAGDNTRYLRRFLKLVLPTLAIIVVMNLVVDPYATLRVGIFEPVVWNARQARVAMLKDLERPPQCIVLGSSRVMKVEPDYVEKLTGLETFIVGVDAGTPEDSLAFLQFNLEEIEKKQEGQQLTTIILGLDIFAFHEDRPLNPGLLTIPELAQHLPGIEAPGFFERYLDNLSYDKTAASLRTVRMTLFPKTNRRKTSVDQRGFLTYIQDEEALAKGNFDPTSRIENASIDAYLNFDNLYTPRLEIVREIVDVAKTHQCKLYIYITPAHPHYVARLKASTPYSTRIDELRAFLKPFGELENVTYFDASELELFGGDPEYFFDASHPRSENNRLIMDKLLGGNTP